MGNGFQFFDIILIAVIAVFLAVRLRNVLGRRDGHEGGDHRDPFRAEEERRDDDNVFHLPGGDEEEPAAADEPGAKAAPAGTLQGGLAELRRADPAFEPSGFIEGARAAFEMVINAYAAGDTATLKNLLSPDVFASFAQAIKDREQARETLEDTLVGIDSAEIVEAYLEGRDAFVTVKFVSQQVNATRDENGDVVDGNPNLVISVTDFWTFSRNTRSRDPNWTLVETNSPE